VHFIDETIEERVDSELKMMLEGEGVRRLISELIDEKLRLFFQDIRIKHYHSGPGRGKIGRTSRKFSASIPNDLFDEIKSLPGLFSAVRKPTFSARGQSSLAPPIDFLELL
jgi:hypothetical protein